jgi:hypothetical protein
MATATKTPHNLWTKLTTIPAAVMIQDSKKKARKKPHMAIGASGRSHCHHRIRKADAGRFARDSGNRRKFKGKAIEKLKAWTP